MTQVATIPPHLSFVKTLAETLWRQVEGDTFALSSMQVFLPTRRACRGLRTAFLQITNGKPLLLPRLHPLGDVDETELAFSAMEATLAINPAIDPLRRQILLVRLIRQKEKDLPLEQVVSLADAFAKLLDQVQIEGARFEDLANLVPENLAQHWQETLDFLKIVTDLWPKVLKDEGDLLDPAERRNRILRAQADMWRDKPPSMPIVAAGSTGSVPAVADLLAVIATLPQGLVILPGLDQKLDEESWQVLAETHPQYGMKKWLEKMDLARSDVHVLGNNESSLHDAGNFQNIMREKLLQESMRPAQTTETWRTLTKDDLASSCVKGLSCLVLDQSQEEADVIALRLRAVLEEPAKTAMLVTPDRALAARVSAALRRWKIEANDSAGSPLAKEEIGSFLQLVLRAAAPDAGAVDYLSLLKHPLAACGVARSVCRERARLVELSQWRGLRRNDGLKGVALSLREKKPELAVWIDEVAAIFAPITEAWNDEVPLRERLLRHIKVAEALASTDQTQGADLLWRDTAGEKAASWLHDLGQAVHDFPDILGTDYRGLFESLIQSVSVHAPYTTHARINILGPLEARLQQADLVILGGLNEGVWPPEAAFDPWLSRPMQRDFGLPLPERRLGLSAHDFVQLACAPEVMLTRSKRSGTTPTVPSRFLLQMQAVLQATGYHTKDHDALACAEPWVEWARLLDQPAEGQIKACAPPAPCPPLEARPKALSVTEISVWQSNPYAIYAKHILKLRKLDELDEPLSASDRGNLVHEALELFMKAHPNKMPDQALALLLETGRQVFDLHKNQPEVEAFWWPRFERIAAWFVDVMVSRQQTGVRTVAVEASGEVALAQGHFTLRGRVDRIDASVDGCLSIIDYKTTKPPSMASVDAAYEPQLPLLALIAAMGGMKGLEASETTELSYWHLQGTKEIGKIIKASTSVDTLMAMAKQRLDDLIEGYGKIETPYLAGPRPKLRQKYNDYAHLAREAEWGTAEDEE